jgi:hypothetical protein
MMQRCGYRNQSLFAPAATVQITMNNRISIASDGLTMKELLTDALCAASMLAGYATMSKPSTRTAAEIGAAIDRALDAYDRISATPEVMLPFPVTGASRADPGNVAGETQFAASAAYSDGSRAAGSVEAGGSRNHVDPSYGRGVSIVGTTGITNRSPCSILVARARTKS